MKEIRMIDSSKMAVVTAHDDYNPMQHLKKIGSELNSLKFKGIVLFDLLSTNGLTDNRFVKIIFNGIEFDRASFCVVEKIDESIKEEQDKIFRSQPRLLHSTVLSNYEVGNF